MIAFSPLVKFSCCAFSCLATTGSAKAGLVYVSRNGLPTFMKEKINPPVEAGSSLEVPPTPQL